MIWNYLIVGFRHLRRYAFYSLLNILGLAVGISRRVIGRIFSH